MNENVRKQRKRNMFTLLWKWLVSIFTTDKIGVLVRLLLLGASKAVIKDLSNTENQRKAYEFVKELNQRTDLTNSEKAALFNEKFLAWAKAGGKAIALSIVNCLREMAVNALKAEDDAKK